MRPYKDPKRLADVMALIQVLSQSIYAIGTDKYLTEQLRGKPTSKKASSWTSLAEEHREFFRVRPPDNKHPNSDVALVWRHAIRAESQDDLEKGKRPPLSAESTGKLLEMAISLYDREATRRQRFNAFVPLAAAVITGLIAIIVLLLQLKYAVPGK